MKILTCNVQGCRNPLTKNHLKNLISKEKPEILFLSKTKNHRSLVKKLVVSFPKYHIVDLIGITWGLVLAWIDVFHFEVVQWNINMVNIIVNTSFDTKQCALTCFYGSPYPSNRNIVWEFSEEISVQISHRNMPWIVIGDFNMIFNQSEKQGGLPFNKVNNEYYYTILERAGLYDLGYVGYDYTWDSHRESNQNIQKKIR